MHTWSVAKHSFPSFRARGKKQFRCPPLTLEYPDRFLGKALCFPVMQRHQIDAPLLLIKAALRFARGLAVLGTALYQSPQPVGCMQIALWTAQRLRVMFGFTVKASDRASTAPAILRVYFITASRWRTCTIFFAYCSTLWRATSAKLRCSC